MKISAKEIIPLGVVNRFLNKDEMVEETIEMLRHKLNRFPRLSKEQLQRIENAKKEFDEGNYLTNSQADKIVDEWLKT